MKKILLIFVFQIWSLLIFSQNYVTFKDGSKFNTDGFMKTCIKSFNSIEANTVICNCFIEKVSKIYNNYSEFESDAVTSINFSENIDEAALNLSQKNNIISSMLDCIKSNSDLLNNNKLKNTDSEQKVLVKQCEINIKKELGIDRYNELQKTVDINNYCDCFISKIFKEFSMKEIIAPSFIANPRRQELLKICINENIK